MKRIRLVDLPLIIKIGFAPAFALLMLALMAGGAIVVQKSQSAALKQVVESDMRQNMEIQKISKRISNINGELYTVLTHKAGNIDVAANDARMAAILTETDAVKKDLAALKAKLPKAEQPKIDELIKSLDECRSAIDTVSGMIGVDFNMAVGFIALAGVAAETGVVMIIYLQHALAEWQQRANDEARNFTKADLHGAIMEGAVERVRPKMMTVVAIMAGLRDVTIPEAGTTTWLYVLPVCVSSAAAIWLWWRR